MIRKLEQRKKDPNLKLKVSTVVVGQNRLARFLAEDGANNRTRLVVFRGSFGEVRNLWRLDMGLGGGGEIFQEISEDDYAELELEQEEAAQEHMEGMDSDGDEDEGEMLVQGIEQPNMGARI